MGENTNLPQRTSDFEFRQQASLSQQLSDQDKIFRKLAGTDPEISDSIGILLVLGEFGIIDLKDENMKLMLSLLDVQRKSHFATSDKVNEITKLGLQMPKRDQEVDADED